MQYFMPMHPRKYSYALIPLSALGIHCSAYTIATVDQVGIKLLLFERRYRQGQRPIVYLHGLGQPKKRSLPPK